MSLDFSTWRGWANDLFWPCWTEMYIYSEYAAVRNLITPTGINATVE